METSGFAAGGPGLAKGGCRLRLAPSGVKVRYRHISFLTHSSTWNKSCYARVKRRGLGGSGDAESLSAGVLATVLHQDPRYYRREPRSGVVKRVVYSISRLAVTRIPDARLSTTGVFGMALGIAASNAYYPSRSRCGEVMAARLGTSVTAGIVGNLISEFWRDIQRKFFHKK